MQPTSQDPTTNSHSAKSILIEASNITAHLGDFTLEDVSFEVPSGDYGVMMGRTGSGKTTLLEIVCGLRRQIAGRISLNGIDVTDRKPADRGIGYVPQDGALFPTMTIWEHLAFAPMIRRWTNAEIDERVEELAAMLGIKHLLDRKPHGLSGGETQRVALGRAIACRPSILCLDEPLSALDEETREDMYDLLKSVQRQSGVTALHVTHSRAEAEALADQMLLLDNGQIYASEVKSGCNLNGRSRSDPKDNSPIAMTEPTE